MKYILTQDGTYMALHHISRFVASKWDTDDGKPWLITCVSDGMVLTLAGYETEEHAAEMLGQVMSWAMHGADPLFEFAVPAETAGEAQE